MSTDLIQRAQDTIGNCKEGDDCLVPTKHPDELKTNAPEFAAFLQANRFAIAAKDYEDKDTTANEAQADFQKTFRRSNWTVFLTSTLIVAVLLLGILAPNWKGVMVALGLLSFAGGFIGSYYLNVLKQGRLLDNWMSSRARAEAARLDYFVSIAHAGSGSLTEPLCDLLKLEYFRRFQLDVQIAYYGNATRRHAKEARRGLKWSSIAVAGAGIITAFAGFASGFINAKFAAVATLGAFFAAISTFASTREDVFHHQRNVERYGRTKDALVHIYETIDDVRTAVVKDGKKPLLDFIEAVHEQLLAEHKQWLSLEEESENAFTRLQETLKQSLSTLPSPSTQQRHNQQEPRPSGSGRSPASSGQHPIAGQPTEPREDKKPRAGRQKPARGPQVPPGQLPPDSGGAGQPPAR
jgi:hypothetical protein